MGKAKIFFLSIEGASPKTNPTGFKNIRRPASAVKCSGHWG
jgi:hypothetical protein